MWPLLVQIQLSQKTFSHLVCKLDKLWILLCKFWVAGNSTLESPLHPNLLLETSDKLQAKHAVLQPILAFNSLQKQVSHCLC